MKRKRKVSVIIPTRNEEGCIGQLLKELLHQPVDEVIIIDGQSTDKTCEEIKKTDERAKVFEQEGYGYGAAIQQGAKKATGDVLILMDADGSMNPVTIPLMLEKIDEGYEYVMGSRYINNLTSDDDTFIRLMGNRFFTWLINFVHKTEVTDSLYTYNAIPAKIFKKIKARSRGFEYCTEILVKARRLNLKFIEIPSKERPRLAGETKVNAFWHGFKILAMILKRYE